MMLSTLDRHRIDLALARLELASLAQDKEMATAQLSAAVKTLADIFPPLEIRIPLPLENVNE